MSEDGMNLVVAKSDGQPAHVGGQSVFLSGRLSPVGARLWVRHAFTNRETVPLELVYAFALPRDGAMRRFRLNGPGWVVKSRLSPIREATQDYERALEQGHRAALVAQHGDGVVNLSMGNIKPGDRLTLWLELMAGVEATKDGYRFRFPLVLPPRYHGEARYGRADNGDLEMELPEDFGDVLLPRWTSVEDDVPRVGFLLDADGPGGIAGVSSPSHPVEFLLRQDGRVRIGATSDQQVPKGDLEIHVRTRRRGPMVVAGAVGDRIEGVAAIPVPPLADGAGAARRVVFLIDQSGSMQGVRLTQAKRAVQSCLALLKPGDQFAVLAFSSRVADLTAGLTDAAAPAIQTAREAVESLEAGGGTDLGPALRRAFRHLGGKAADVVLVTDGDVSGTEALVRIAASSGIRIHTLGIETAAAERFLHQMAEATGGQCRCVASGGRVDGEIMMLFQPIGNHLVINSLRLSGLADARLEPAPPRSAFPGSVMPVTFSGAIAGDAVQINVDFAGTAITIPVAVGSPGDGEYARLLRGARLMMMAEYGGGGETPATAELVRIGTEYGLANQAMGLVAVVEREGDLSGELPQTQVLPSAYPAALHMMAYAPIAGQPFMQMRRGSTVLHSLLPMTPASAAAALHGLQPRSQVMYSLVMLDSDFDTPATNKSPHDVVYDLVATLGLDGGLPGATRNERLVATTLLLLLMAELGETGAGKPLFAISERVRGFLRSQAGNHQTVTHVLNRLDAGGPIPGPWMDMLQRRDFREASLKKALAAG